MKAASKQQILLGFSIFLALTAIGFSFSDWQFLWLWQRMPWTALFLMLLAFYTIRLWFILELARQKEIILRTFQDQQNTMQEDLYKLLSIREKEVLQLIRQGKSNKEIADQLFIAHSTVKTHINNIYKLLEVKSRREVLEKVQPK